jgi:hypothetical protein
MDEFQIASRYDALDMEQVRKLAKEGYSDAWMANFFDVTPAVWDLWRLAYPDFDDQLRRWMGEADDQVERSAFMKATGNKTAMLDLDTDEMCFEDEYRKKVVMKFVPPSDPMIKYWLNNRRPHRWSEKVEVNIKDNALGQELDKARQRLAKTGDAKQLTN